MLDEPAGQQTTLKNHVALIVPSHKLQDFVDEILASQCDDDAAVADALSKVTLAHVASLGSLNLCGSWEGLNGQALGLQEPMGSSEHVTLFVGEFVGDLACAIAVLKASFFKEPSRSFCGLFSAHCGIDRECSGDGWNVLQQITPLCVNLKLATRGQKLSTDQEDLLERIASSNSAFHPVEAVPGAGKTFVGAQIFEFITESLSQTEKVYIR